MPGQSNLPGLPPQPRGIHIRHVPGWPGYAVTDAGEVWSCRRRHTGQILPAWHRLRLASTAGRYQKVNLSTDSRAVQFSVHRLVLIAFVGEAPRGEQACHANGNSRDNRLLNLRWGSASANGRDRIKHGRSGKGSANVKAKLSDDDVRAIRLTHAAGHSYRMIAQRFGIGAQMVRLIVLRKYWRHVS